MTGRSVHFERCKEAQWGGPTSFQLWQQLIYTNFKVLVMLWVSLLAHGVSRHCKCKGVKR